MPKPSHLGWRITLHLAESVIIPLGLFYGVQQLFGLWPALAAAAGWALAAITVHLLRGGKPSTLLLVTGGLAALQIGLTAASRSAVVYFLQPTVAAYVFGGVMLATSIRRPPLLERLAADFCPMPADFVSSAVVQRLFRRLSWVWAAVLGINATVTLAFLLTLSTTIAVPLATVASVPMFLAGLAISHRWFVRAVTVGGFILVWGGRPDHRQS
jgi:hypothetical protein